MPADCPSDDGDGRRASFARGSSPRSSRCPRWRRTRGRAGRRAREARSCVEDALSARIRARPSGRPEGPQPRDRRRATRPAPAGRTTRATARERRARAARAESPAAALGGTTSRTKICRPSTPATRWSPRTTAGCAGGEARDPEDRDDGHDGAGNHGHLTYVGDGSLHMRLRRLPSPLRLTWGSGGSRPRYTDFRTSAASLPPKASEVEMAHRTGASRATLATTSTAQSGSVAA